MGVLGFNDDRVRDGGLVTFALEPLAQRFALAANRFGFLACATLRRLLVSAAPFHFAQHAFALELLFQNTQRLADIVVADDHLQTRSPLAVIGRKSGNPARTAGSLCRKLGTEGGPGPNVPVGERQDV